MTVPARYTLTEAHFRIAELEGRVAEQDAEIQRLTEERDVARDQRDSWQEVAEDAEAELERLRRHPDAWSQRAFDEQKQRAEAAEDKVRRLTEGLSEIRANSNKSWVIQKIDVLLAGSAAAKMPLEPDPAHWKPLSPDAAPVDDPFRLLGDSEPDGGGAK